jgi:hypothetical protein
MPLSTPSHLGPVRHPHKTFHSNQRPTVHKFIVKRAVSAHETGAAASADRRPPRAKGKVSCTH